MLRPTYQHGFFAPRKRRRARYPSLWRGCVGAWCPSLGATGSSLFDWSAFRNHGTLNNQELATDWLESGGGLSLNFNSTDPEYIECGNAANVTGALTISAWVRRTGASASNGSGLVGRWVGNPTANRQYLLYTTVTNNYYAFLVSSTGSYEAGGDLISTTASTLNTWEHVAAVFRPSQEQAIFVNGKSVVSDTTSILASAYSSAATLRFGNHFFATPASSTGYDGQLDDIRIYNRALAPQEIATLAKRRRIAYEIAPERYGSGDAAAAVANPKNVMRGIMLDGPMRRVVI